jgi:hypothetical protein
MKENNSRCNIENQRMKSFNKSENVSKYVQVQKLEPIINHFEK